MKYLGRILAAIASLLAVAAFCLACYFFRPAPIIRLDNLVYDSWMRLAEKPELNPVPAIVDIDDASLEKLGQWPWPRTQLAQLVEKILSAGALAVGLDILLAEPDRTSPAHLKANLEERHGLTVSLQGIPPELLDNDQYFIHAIRDRPVVLGAFATFSDGRLPPRMPRSTGVVEIKSPQAPGPRDKLVETQGLLAPLELLSEAAPVGIINSSFHEDGVIRSVPLLIRAGDNIYASLALRTLMAAQGVGTLRLHSNQGGLQELKTGDVSIPIAPDGSIRPFYMGKARSYPYFSAADILEGRIGERELADRIVFIGTSSIGLMDMRATPLDPVAPGVEVHATLVDNMLSGLHMSIPPHITGWQIIAIALSASLALALFGLLPAYIYVTGALAYVAGCLWLSWHLFAKGIFVSPVYAILATVLMGVLIVPLRFWHEQRARRQIKAAFAHYVAPELVNRIAAHGPEAIKGQTREVSVLFTDIRGFTTISENMEPDRLVRMLNSYFTPMTACVIARQGTLDKFIGDALMAFWNAPLDVASHQEKAVRAALDMQTRLAGLRPGFLREFGAKIEIGAGIHCGPVRVGNMGSSDLLNYTCIGDNVNLASRMEGLCKRYGVGIVVSASVMSQCPGLAFRQLDRIRVKGSSRPLEIYTPLAGAQEGQSSFELDWREALGAYFAGDFAGASYLFAGLLQQDDENVAIRLFMGRCARLQAQPPQDWAGVWTYDSK